MATKKEKVLKATEEAAKSAQSVVVQQPTVLSICLEIEGTAPIIQNNFSQKAVEQMLRKHMGISVQRETKKPIEILEQATIRNTDGRVCVPPTAIKKAMLTGAGSVKGLKPWQLRTQLFVEGKSIPITYESMRPRMDMVRTAGVGRAPDVRFRPEFSGWKARLVIQFGDLVAVQTVVDLLHRAGTVGVGEWRPEKSGTFGTFKVVRNIDDPKEVAEVREICATQLVPLEIPTWALNADLDPALLQKIMGEQVTSSDEPNGDDGEGGADQKTA